MVLYLKLLLEKLAASSDREQPPRYAYPSSDTEVRRVLIIGSEMRQPELSGETFVFKVS